MKTGVLQQPDGVMPSSSPLFFMRTDIPEQ
jgi:hypothetical protein